MREKVSVIITTYKGSNNIKRAVESVLEQSYTNLEIIIVDDNGINTEEQVLTKKIINDFNDDRIIYIAHEKNINGSAARNTGISYASGEYIALLDDDDTFRNNKIELQMKRMLELNCEVSYTSMSIHMKDGKNDNIVSNKEGYIFKDVLLRKIKAPSSVLMFSKSIVNKVGGFDESFKRHQDWEFLDRMSFISSICVVNEICMDRYITKRNSAQDIYEYEKNRLYYLHKMKEYINKLSCEEQKELYFKHYFDIVKESLKAKNIKKAIKYCMLCKNILRVVNNIILLTIKSNRGKL